MFLIRFSDRHSDETNEKTGNYSKKFMDQILNENNLYAKGCTDKTLTRNNRMTPNQFHFMELMYP